MGCPYLACQSRDNRRRTVLSAQLARCGTCAHGSTRKRVLLVSRNRLAFRWATVHPMNRSRSRHFQAAEPKTKHASKRPWPSHTRVLQVLPHRSTKAQVMELAQRGGDLLPLRSALADL